jgi:pyruvate formate lyase activating enzyme
VTGHALRTLRTQPRAAPLLGAGGREDADAHDPGTGSITGWDISTGVDGPGTRFVVFTAGCPLRCLYCHNPETWRMRDGHVVASGDVVDEIARYADFIRAAGGGVTISGGEPLLQPAFTRDVFAGARRLGLHTALDTAGSVAPSAAIDALLEETDLVLLDIKAADPERYRTVTGGRLERTLAFAEHLADRDQRTWVRFVLVPGLTDDAQTVEGVARTCAQLGNVDRVDVLPYHRLGAHKYDVLGIDYPLASTPVPDAQAVDAALEVFRAAGLEAY